MSLDPATLLDGPRGRRLCLEFLTASFDADSDAAREASEKMFWVGHILDPNPGTLLQIGGDGGDIVVPEVGATEAARALGRVTVPAADEPTVRTALAQSVSLARYWQEPDGLDALAATDDMRPVLARAAAVIAAAPSTAWWRSPAALDDQWTVQWDDTEFVQRDPRQTLQEWRRDAHEEEVRAERERPRDPTAMWSGTWWSTPPYTLLHTTRSLGDPGPSELWHIEDGFDWKAATTTPVAPPDDPRVFEIDGVDAWIDLCRRHPLEVTASRRHDWYRVTGRDGVWVQPDWAAVAREYDGVHLSVAGYLTGATRLIDVGDGRASVVAGWAPDATYWFVPVTPGEPSVRWRLDDENAWRLDDAGAPRD